MTAATRDGALDVLDGFKLERRGRRNFRHVGSPTELSALTLAEQGDDAVLPVDPVCRMAVDPARSSEQRRYQNVVYRFCSDECARVFDVDPGRYAAGQHKPPNR